MTATDATRPVANDPLADEPAAPSNDKSASVGSSMLITGLGGIAELLGTLGVGILTSRYLMAEGRGEYTAIVIWVTTAGLVGSFGLRESIVLVLSKRPGQESKVMGTVFAMIAGLTLLATAVAELLIPLGFSQQTPEAIRLAQLAMFATGGVVAHYALQGVLAALERFRALALAQVAHPILLFCVMRTLWIYDDFNVTTAVATKLVVMGSIAVLGMLWALRQTGAQRPSGVVARELFSYGSRLQVYNLGQISNGQLDILILPAFVIADEIGYYGVSVLTASTIIVVVGRVSAVVLPLVGRAGPEEGRELLVRSMRVVLAGSIAAALGLAVVAEPVFRTVLGEEFSASVKPLLFLLPGIVAWSVNMSASAGLQAFDKPGRSSWSQASAVLVTVVGLSFSVPKFGILGAGATSTCAYITALVVSLWFLSAECNVEVRGMLRLHKVPEDLKILASQASPSRSSSEP